jgi:hypothetical protein
MRLYIDRLDGGDRRTLSKFLTFAASIAVSTLCFNQLSLAACDKRPARTVGEYALVAGVAGPAPSASSRQGTGLFGIGLGIFVNSRIDVQGDLLLTPQGSIAGGAQIEYLPFRDAFTTGCLVPYLSAGGAGESDYLYAGPAVGGGFKYYSGNPFGLGLDAKAILPQPNSPTVFKGTVYQVTLRLLFDTR